MRILVVGAGAIGGFYGAHLAHTGRDVTFLVRPGRAGQLARTGLVVKSPKGDISLMPNVVTANALKSIYDVILIAVKGFALESVIADVAPAVGPDSMILAPLNGMKHIDILTARFGQGPVIGCIARIGVDLDSEGRIVHFAPMEDMAYGERDGSRSERAMALDSFMKEAGFTARLSDNISREMWEKWILLAALGGINCLMHGNIGEVEAAQGGLGFVFALLDEIVAIVNKVGIPPHSTFVENTRGLLTTKGSPMTSSMFRDMSKGLQLEADTIIGDLLFRGSEVGLASPLLRTVNTSLCVYQNHLR